MSLKNTDVSWQEIDDSCRAIAEKLKNGTKYDCIVCVGRGGMVPARLMSEYLDIKDIKLIPAHYDGKVVVIGDEIDFCDFEGKNVLVVDEVYQTGKSINTVCNEIFDCAEEVFITTCTCYFNKNSETKPNLYHYEYDDSTDWLVFPWERCTL